MTECGPKAGRQIGPCGLPSLSRQASEYLAHGANSKSKDLTPCLGRPICATERSVSLRTRRSFKLRRVIRRVDEFNQFCGRSMATESKSRFPFGEIGTDSTTASF